MSSHRRVMPNNPFLLIRGLDRKIVSDLIAEYFQVYATTGQQVYSDRVLFPRNLEPLVFEHVDQTPYEVAQVKAKLRQMVEKM